MLNAEKLFSEAENFSHFAKDVFLEKNDKLPEFFIFFDRKEAFVEAKK